MNRFEVRTTPAELDLGLCVSSGQVFRWRRLPSGSWLGADGGHWFVVDASDPCRLQVESNALEADFARLFRLDEDLRAHLRKIGRRAPELRPYIAQLPGLRVMRPSDPVEEAFCFLCTPNNNLPRILQMVRALSEVGPVLRSAEGERLHRFPALETIAALDESFLRERGFGYRARTVPSIARQMAERGGARWLASLKDRPYQEAHAALCSLKGVGPKLADCIALFALHHTCAVPVDTHLWQAAVRHYFPRWKDRSLTEQRYRAVGDLFRERHGDLAGWAHQYLFYDNLKNWRSYAKR